MAIEPVRGFGDLAGKLESEWLLERYRIFAVLLYAPLNGLNEKLHNYVLSRWMRLNSLTGPDALFLVVEDVEHGVPITEFKPDEIYLIARELGAEVSDVPCVIIFTDPSFERETIILRLRPILPKSTDVTDEDLTSFFQELQAAIDRCLESSPGHLHSCLFAAIKKQWPEQHDRNWPTKEKVESVRSGLASAASVLESIASFVTAIAKFD